MRSVKFLAATVLLLAITACGASKKSESATSAPAPTVTPQVVRVEVQPSSLGDILTDQDGRTLYAFAKDKDGSSSCTGQCVATWPALISTKGFDVGSGAKADLLGKTQRTEGTAQATYNAWPLYFFAGDTGPGDVDGQGVDGAWFVVGADGKLIKTTS